MLKLLSGAYKNNKKEMIIIVLLSVINSLVSGVSILILIPILDFLEIGGSSDIGVFSFALSIFSGMDYIVRVVIVLLIYVMLMVSVAVLNRFIKIYNAKFVQKYIKELRAKVYNAVINSDWEHFAAQKHADLLNSFTSEISKISNAVTSFIRLFSILLTSITQVAIALTLNVELTLLVMVVGGIMLFALRKYFAIAKQNGERMRVANKQYLGEIRGQLNSIKEIKSYGVEDYNKELLNEVLDEFEHSNLRKIEMATKPPMLYSISSAVFISILFFIANVILKIDMVSLALILYIFMRIWPIFSNVQGQIQSILSSLPSAENVEKLLVDLKSVPTRASSDIKAVSFKNEIKFDNISFSYLNSDEVVLENISFTIKANTITAIKGKSGVGKSTIVNLLMGLLKPTEGEIRIDNVVLDNENIQAFRKKIGYMPQDPIMLNRTIKENIARFNPTVTEDEIYMALEKAQALDFVKRLPDGIDTLMGNKGVRLSGGEKQRIVLARVLAKSPSILILDEATSALDKENEENIQNIIKNLSDNVTVIVISHRQSSIENAESIICI